MSSNISLKTLLLLVPLMLLISGCRSSHHDPYTPNRLVIQNDFNSVGDIWYAYVTPSTAPTWGSDLLSGDVLFPGDELIVDVYDCNRYYDILVEYEFGPVIEQYDVWLSCNTTTIISFRDW